MKRKFSIVLIALFLLSVLFISCQPKPVMPSTAAAPAKSDGSKDLTIDFQVNLSAEDAENHFTFKGNIRYMAADKDHFDAETGASALGSTHLFQSYLYDVEGKTTMSSALRGLFLFGVNPLAQVKTDNLTANKASDGTITIMYAHRGSAYKITTDNKGKLALPGGKFERRVIGYISGSAPQVISKDFSADGTAQTIDWVKVWDSGVADGNTIGDSNKKTGPITPYGASADVMYIFDGVLDVSLSNDILKISGVLTAVKQ